MAVSSGLKEFVDLLEVIADNKFMLGDRLVENGIGAPDIEASIAAIAMAQGELGHSRILYNWAHDLAERPGSKPEITDQTGKAFQGVLDADNWIKLIAALLTVDVAQDLVLSNILKANRQDVITRIHKLYKEQKEHILYSHGWAKKLLNDEGAIPKKFREALDSITPEVEAWLKKLDESQELVAEGFITENANFAENFRARLAGLLEQAGEIAHAH